MRSLWAFCSAKGGVGKSTLAVVTAKLLASMGRTCVLVDADLTGTSLADGLSLCAPKVRIRDDGAMDLDAEPERLLSREETLKARNVRSRDRREGSSVPPAKPPPFLNDVLVHQREPPQPKDEPFRECLVASTLWKHEASDGVLYLPSSPCDKDIAIALGWLYFEARETWIARMTWLFDAMRQQISGLTDIVLDLPPGLFGFADEAMELLAHLDSGEPMPPGYPVEMGTERGRWQARPFLVTTPDRNDLGVSIAYFVRRRQDFPALTPIINRCDESLESIATDVRSRFGALVDASMLRRVETGAELSGLFRAAGDVDISRLPKLTETLGLLEGTP